MPFGSPPPLGPPPQRDYVPPVSPRCSFLALLVLAAACDSPPSADGLREWTPADHDRAEESARAAAGQSPAPGAIPSGTPGGRPDPVLEATWAQQCAPCHGPVGRGDGPTGPMVHAADLTRPEWQASVTDADIARVIVNGKARMPAFPTLPPKVVSGLVARVRAARER